MRARVLRDRIVRGAGRQGIGAWRTAFRAPTDVAHFSRGGSATRDVAVVCVRALLARRRFDPTTIEHVIVGCSNQQGEQGLRPIVGDPGLVVPDEAAAISGTAGATVGCRYSAT